MPILITSEYNLKHKRIQRDTLLGEFIQQRMDAYIEPQRKGTAKGDDIGLSDRKYEASLYGVTNLKIKDVARILDVPYGVLRKWRTEERFKEMIKRHCRDFATRVCDYINKLAQEELEFEQSGRPGDDEYFEYLAEHMHRVDDGGAYGLQLCEKIRAIIEKKVVAIDQRKKEGISNAADTAYLAVLERVLRWSEIKLNSKQTLIREITARIEEEEQKHLNSLREQGLTIIDYDPIALFEKVMVAENLTDREREQAIQLLEFHLEILKKGYHNPFE